MTDTELVQKLLNDAVYVENAICYEHIAREIGAHLRLAAQRLEAREISEVKITCSLCGGQGDLGPANCPGVGTLDQPCPKCHGAGKVSELGDALVIVEEYIGGTENWELVDDGTPDPTEAIEALEKIRGALKRIHNKDAVMTETNAELAENITETADAAERTGGNVYLSVDRQRLLRLAAQRLEAREISEERLEAAITAAKEWLEPPHDEMNIRHAIGAALEAALNKEPS